MKAAAAPRKAGSGDLDSGWRTTSEDARLESELLVLERKRSPESHGKSVRGQKSDRGMSC